MAKARTRSLLFLPPALALVFLVASLAWHWNDRLLGAHHVRQAHTAQNVEMYALTGWRLFKNVARFVPRPGYFLLEMPVYQSAVYALVSASGLSIEQAGRFVNALLGLLCALGLLRLFAELCPDEARRRGSGWTAMATPLALVFSLPLLFGVSLWILPDLLGLVAGVWALVFFLRAERREDPLKWAAAHGACLALSIWIKPTVLVASAPFYVSLPFRRRASAGEPPRRLLRQRDAILALASIAGVAAGLAWFAYAQEVNLKVGGHFKISDRSYYVGALVGNPAAFARFAARFLFYVVGAGTLGALAWAWFALGSGPSARSAALRHALLRPQPPRALVFTCLASCAIYFLVFINLNVRHSYYQLPFLIPVSLLVLWTEARLGDATPALKRAWPLVIAAAVALNVTVANRQLLFVDRDLDAAVTDVQAQLVAGIDRPDVVFYDNNDSGSAIAYYLQRWLRAFEWLKDPSERKGFDWLAVCDRKIALPAYDDCHATALKLEPECGTLGREYGGTIWACVVRRHL